MKIILAMAGHPVDFSRTAKETGCNRETVSTWFHRISTASDRWDDLVKQALEEPGHAGFILRKQRLALEFFADNPRSGAPCTYSAKQYTDIITLALKPPSDFGRPITNWTARELTDEAHLQGTVSGISVRQVGRFLDEATLKPHRSTYWLNPKIDDPAEHEKQVLEICGLYSQAPKLHAEGIHLVSTDEKTSIQALERCAPTKRMIPGHPEKIEAEYKRHGTLCLIPSFEVATGEILRHRIGVTRDEKDFSGHIATTIESDPDARWIFILDQLNTHMSESLVRLVAKLCEYEGDLGTKGGCGILKDIESRKEFLSDPKHKVRFVYTPKHCSWLNQVEIWFGTLVRKVLKRGNFSSVEDLRQKMELFIDYFNRTMAKPYKWTYKGTPLVE